MSQTRKTVQVECPGCEGEGQIRNPGWWPRSIHSDCCSVCHGEGTVLATVSKRQWLEAFGIEGEQ